MIDGANDCIVAIASPAGVGLRGIVRLSGGNVAEVVGRVFRSAEDNSWKLASRAIAVPGNLSLRETQIELPCRLYYWPNARSYTGEPIAELHTVGAPPLLERLLEEFVAAGARLARPGEFTLRAFLAGRIDLTQAEAVLGVIDARGERELNNALEQLAGGLAGPLRGLREQLLDLLAHLEAGLDFVEEDIEFISRSELLQQLEAARSTVELVREKLRARDANTSLPRVALVGPPNAGKSSLFNALLGKQQAIVTPLPGTTRDYLSARLDLDGLSCELVDTAGIDEANAATHVDRAAQGQTHRAREQAAIELVCQAANSDVEAPQPTTAATRLRVLTKIDTAEPSRSVENGLATSAHTGAGLDALRTALRAALAEVQDAGDTGVRATAGRCRESLANAESGLQRALDLVRHDAGEELIAAEVRAVLTALGEVIGAVYTDDLLDRVFSRFCIGK